MGSERLRRLPNPATHLKTESGTASGCWMSFVGSLCWATVGCPDELLMALLRCVGVWLFGDYEVSLLCNVTAFALCPQTDADPEVCKRMCKANDFENVLSLVSYYQMVRCDVNTTKDLMFDSNKNKASTVKCRNASERTAANIVCLIFFIFLVRSYTECHHFGLLIIYLNSPFTRMEWLYSIHL